MHTPTHTPGPWIQSKAPDAVITAHCPPECNGESDHQAYFEHYGGHVIAESVDARDLPFITAVPDMYAALQIALQCCQYANGERKRSWDQQFVRETIEKALAKAEAKIPT